MRERRSVERRKEPGIQRGREGEGRKVGERSWIEVEWCGRNVRE